MKMYGDDQKEAFKNIEKSDKNRLKYYPMVFNKEWRKAENYDLCIDSSIGKAQTADLICEYIKMSGKQ